MVASLRPMRVRVSFPHCFHACVLVLAGMMVLALPGSADAALLAHWEADNTPGAGGANSAAATWVADDLSASTVTRNTGTISYVSAPAGVINTSLSAGSAFANSGWGNATPTNYYQFNIQADENSDFNLNITEVGFYTVPAAQNRQATYRLDYSTDPTFATFVQGTEQLVSWLSTDPSTYEWKSLSQAVTVIDASAVYFRLYIWNTRSINGSLDNGQTIRVDDIQIQGAAIPEPASLALLSLGGVLMLRRRQVG